jgi:UDP-N-acetylmuramate: L-alanyl-gamma-D-glutamyl-meso-diaminopimelate ligase
MHVHILGICGTFMGGLAVLAQQSGFKVTGCDANVYPPMSTQLEALGIDLVEGWDPAQLGLGADVYVVGNVVSRGNPLIEAILERGLPYVSGPQWLSETLLRDRWVLAVSGTHGKTTTTSMLAWILDYAGLAPSFLVGGVPLDFGVSARVGRLGEGVGEPSPFFVIEADEYDTAFFDKRSKFVHYRARTAILNNLEFDHADIFPDLAAIETQFHHLVRIVPRNGLLVVNGRDDALVRVLERGAWTPVERFDVAAGWHASPRDATTFDVSLGRETIGRVAWHLLGDHNRSNALAAIAAARHAGVPPRVAVEALNSFRGVRRRMELRGEARGVRLYDDFAHHPSAIRTTVAGLRRVAGDARILAVVEPRSNTMKRGVWAGSLADSLSGADLVFCYGADLGWDVAAALRALGERVVVV